MFELIKNYLTPTQKLKKKKKKTTVKKHINDDVRNILLGQSNIFHFLHNAINIQ